MDATPVDPQAVMHFISGATSPKTSMANASVSGVGICIVKKKDA
ncbi:MAG: hypothetical protein ACM3UY_03980 [Methanocella sp.]